ncbi:MAG: hypothetical protein DWC10_02950 [Candidatus Poseidoniales archaeon]|nr:MAG: hypothetical protein DWC10_02950 [Candidatus Poseidoniales archaeon]
MGAGGTAPKMKMSDVFILTGLTVLLGALFMHAWVTPINLNSGDPPYTNGASLMTDDKVILNIMVENETTIRVVFMDESNSILSAESIVMGAGDSVEREFLADQGGFYTYEIDTKGVAATLDVEIDRKLMLDMLPFPIGAFFLAFGLYQRQMHTEESAEVLDAELDV